MRQIYESTRNGQSVVVVVVVVVVAVATSQ